MLLKHKDKIDTDGYLMLFLSVFVIFATAGISYLFIFEKHICLRNRQKHHARTIK